MTGRLALVMWIGLTLAGNAQGDNAGAGFDQYQIGYLRDYMASQRFFDRLNYLGEQFDYEQADIEDKVILGDRAARSSLSWILREYPLSIMTYHGLFYGATATVSSFFIPHVWHMYRYASQDMKMVLPIFGVVPAMLVVNPLVTMGSQAYYTILPPSIPEASLIYQYGAKKNLLDKSTQHYIEDELFYAFWQSPSSDGLYRLHKILDKALRLPSYTKELTYDSQKIRNALRNFPSELIDRLDRFALAEINRQKMKKRPVGHYPVYFQGAPGTGKTYAAKKLAKAMGTNLVTVTLDGATIDDMVGTPFESFDGKAGRILDAIISSTTSTHDLNHHNQILMIDEFDRLMLSGDKQSEEVLSFLLKLLDPTHRYYYNPYLKTEIRLPDTIILAGNSDIHQLSQQHPQFEAMASRLNRIDFPGFSQETKRAIAFESIIPQIEESYRSIGEDFADYAFPESERALVEAFISGDDDPGLRSLEKYIHDLSESLVQVLGLGNSGN